MITYRSNLSLKSVNPNYKGNVKINGRFEASEILHNLGKSEQINGNLKILAIGETFYLNE